ncbi:hypothetical protein [Polaromonas jejuensis]|uniref:Uncharacterized protein n=1 Tax=Polaromonas jejuensis TaxID=457502 RepID=A0ABW0Q7P3_9BURK|nr:hypothetical protein [Polaromonas jejuensis]
MQIKRHLDLCWIESGDQQISAGILRIKALKQWWIIENLAPRLVLTTHELWALKTGQPPASRAVHRKPSLRWSHSSATQAMNPTIWNWCATPWTGSGSCLRALRSRAAGPRLGSHHIMNIYPLQFEVLQINAQLEKSTLTAGV